MDKQIPNRKVGVQFFCWIFFCLLPPGRRSSYFHIFLLTNHPYQGHKHGHNLYLSACSFTILMHEVRNVRCYWLALVAIKNDFWYRMGSCSGWILKVAMHKHQIMKVTLNKFSTSFVHVRSWRVGIPLSFLPPRHLILIGWTVAAEGGRHPGPHWCENRHCV